MDMVVSCYGYYLIPQSKLHTKTEQYLPTLWLMLLHLEYETIYACVYIEA